MRIVRSAHEYLPERWTVSEFLAARTDLTEALLLDRGLPLTAIRQDRTHQFPGALVAAKRAAFQSSNAYGAYSEFLARLRLAKVHLLPEPPFLLKSESTGDTVLISVGSLKDAQVGLRITVQGQREGDVRRLILGLLVSEFADEIALVLGDTTESRIFSLRVLLSALLHARDVKSPPSAAVVRSQLVQIAALSHQLQRAMRESNHAQMLIRGCCTPHLTEPGHKTSVGQEPPATVLSVPWDRMRDLLEDLSASASKAGKKLPVRRGRVANSANNYTPVILIADAWKASFGSNPSHAVRSRFASVFGYCSLLFTHGTIDLRAGLKFWKETETVRSQLGDDWLGANLSLFGIAPGRGAQGRQKGGGIDR